MLVVLGKNYRGDRISGGYAIDPATGKKLKFDIDMSVSPGELEAVISGRSSPDESWKTMMDYAMPILYRRASDREQARLVEDAFREVAADMGLKPGEEIRRENASVFSERMAHAVTKRLMPLLRGGNGPTDDTQD